MTDHTLSTTTNTKPRTRQIRFWGSAARLLLGTASIVAAVLTGAGQQDLIIGLLVLPTVEVALLLARGPGAEPLRMFGGSAYFLNWGVGIAAFTLVPQAAFLFYGASILLAFARGYAGCEIFAISNWLRRRDDQIVCPIFSPIDQAEARRAGTSADC
jgi:hypothetical protein